MILKSPLFNGTNLKGMLSRPLFILVAFLNPSEVLIKGLITAFLASSLDLFLPVSWIYLSPEVSHFFLFFSFSFSIVFHLSRLELRNNLLFLNSDISGLFIAFFLSYLCPFVICCWPWVEAGGTFRNLLGGPFSWAVQLIMCIFHFLH